MKFSHHPRQPFVASMGSVVESLKNMATTLETELKALLTFYGENPESPDAPKPEDFFGLVLSFSSQLQVRSLLLLPLNLLIPR